jgi:uncharacterized protein (TIGR02391 family)
VDAKGARKALRLAAELAADVAKVVRVAPAEGHISAVEAMSALTLGTPYLYDLLIDDPELRHTTRELFINGHYAQSVEEAFKYLNNLVKHRSGLAADGADLMTRALSAGSPALKLSELKSQSQRDQQVGYMMMLAGAMTGVRNPRAHEHLYLDDPRSALELMCFANHLARLIRGARRARRRSLQPRPAG